ncbi:unnamed protein product [Darwinula stevensoni]|uniref:Tigger transposable element-derived protein 4 n=1 Tax=Darwinula stevensoni TaxID=69355 RepID=A0A7R8X1S2_9CRUS|nr:unnamed protein product [Darwinula stevensoni]CAG0883060.1 unnamed protein product [Darwinula stevensoni]
MGHSVFRVLFARSSEFTDLWSKFTCSLISGSEMAHVAKKRKCMSIELKIDILREVEEGKLKKGEISAKYDIPPSTLSSIVSAKEKIRKEFFNASFAPGRKKLRGAKYGDIEEALFEWFQQARACNIALDGNTIRQKAAELAKVLGIEKLECSSGWLSRFKDRHGIVFKKVCGEAGSVPDEIVNKWKNETLRSIIGSHRPEDIFNADETSLFFNLTPEKTMQVSPDAVANCFRKAGFCHGESTQEETDIAPPMESDDAWEEIASQLQVGCEFTQFVNIDEDVPTCEPLPNPAMCAEAHGVMELEDAANEEEMEEQPAIPKSRNVMEAVETIKLHLYHACHGNEKMLRKISDIEKFFLKRATSSRQTCIRDYLQS